MKITVVRGDITEQHVDAIITAANEPLRGGGGVDGAVHRAAGRELLRACRELAPCPTGSAVITPAFGITQVDWVIHAVGPVYQGRPSDADLLASAYRASLARAEEVGAASVAFPSISTGVYGYPLDEAAAVSVRALLEAKTEVEDVVLVAFGADMHDRWERALGAPSTANFATLVGGAWLTLLSELGEVAGVLSGARLAPIGADGVTARLTEDWVDDPLVASDIAHRLSALIGVPVSVVTAGPEVLILKRGD